MFALYYLIELGFSLTPRFARIIKNMFTGLFPIAIQLSSIFLLIKECFFKYFYFHAYFKNILIFKERFNSPIPIGLISIYWSILRMVLAEGINIMNNIKCSLVRKRKYKINQLKINQNIITICGLME